MSESLSLVLDPPVYAVLDAARHRTGVSTAAVEIYQAISKVGESLQRSIELFGRKRTALSALYQVAIDCQKPGWDFEDAEAVAPEIITRAEDFILALPDKFPMPEIGGEPDGEVSLDWIHSRKRMFSVSIGKTERLPFAWVDGTDLGNGVARFDGITVPAKILNGVRETMEGPNAAIRVA